VVVRRQTVKRFLMDKKTERKTSLKRAEYFPRGSERAIDEVGGRILLGDNIDGEGEGRSCCGRSGSNLLQFGYTFISVFNQPDAQNLFYNKFYFMPLHVSSTCARNM
jgi:hypothetical protein